MTISLPLRLFLIPKSALRFCFEVLIKPKASTEDERRHEFILNVLLVGSLVLTSVAAAYTTIQQIHNGTDYSGVSPVIILAILGFFATLLLLSRLKLFQLSSYVLIFMYYLIGLYVISQWGILLAQGFLIFVLAIVMAGVLVGSWFAFAITFLISLSLILVAYFTQAGIIRPDLDWVKDPGNIHDAIVYVFNLTIIAIVSWLSNREIERSLKRARNSERALKDQRDSLEITVEERTQELKQAQVEKMLQLYRFAEFGRMAQGFMHDLANPLTAVSLNLEELKSRKSSETLLRAIEGTRRMQRFIEAARRQVQHHEHHINFDVCDEIHQSIMILNYKAKSQQIILESNCDQKILTLGNPIKFQQIITNLISNAIDAYDGSNLPAERRIVKIGAELVQKEILITVQDFGSGIPADKVNKIFEPFFTTKSPERGTGIGLSITKEIIEKDFGGKINVTSEAANGTIFTVSFPKRVTRA